jgi:hypothetical protein
VSYGLPAFMEYAYPHTFWNGSVQGSGSATSGAPAPGKIWLLCGVDAWGLTQPNNGTFIFEINYAGTYPTTVLVVQQSANFPGPWAWRGFQPQYSAGDGFQASADISFGWSAWGLVVPDYTFDGGIL